ncbi:MAG: transcription elongation factor GreA [Candidatus Levybacteria bacterium]|nr:transcription elongation factor GreA [Candidatus Levybacteria bacterium]MBP9815429.1 transcription elongation factor GreA [Candidatus Levybacteria bacterium]
MPKLTTHDKLSKLNKISFTKEGYQNLLTQLTELKNTRPAAVKELARARELGDLSENGLYTAAKARLSSIDNQIFRAEMTIKFAEVVNESESHGISIGSTVVVDDGNNETTYLVVGDTEANPKENKVTQHSPIGRALIGKNLGDSATLILPSGTKKLYIKKVS